MGVNSDGFVLLEFCVHFYSIQKALVIPVGAQLIGCTLVGKTVVFLADLCITRVMCLSCPVLGDKIKQGKCTSFHMCS